jgi:hypothetical protein
LILPALDLNHLDRLDRYGFVRRRQHLTVGRRHRATLRDLPGELDRHRVSACIRPGYRAVLIRERSLPALRCLDPGICPLETALRGELLLVEVIGEK